MKILGAGIAGLTAAINLAKMGSDVDVYEKNSDVGLQIKQTPQMLPNWMCKDDIVRYLERFNIKINPVARVSKALLFVKDIELKFHTRTPIGYTVLRGGPKSFEMDLKKQAQKAGAEIHTNQKRRVKANIIATGAQRPRAIIYGKVYSGKFNPNKVSVIVDFEKCPGGYAYLYPHDKKRASFVLGKLAGTAAGRTDIKKDIVKIFESYKSVLGLEGAEFAYDFGKFSDFDIPKSAVVNGSLLVGEAAGFQDPFLGFGMKFAVQSGYLAARALVEKLDYDAMWKEELLPEFERLLNLRHIVFNPLNEGLVGMLPKGGMHIIDMDVVQDAFNLDLDEFLIFDVLRSLF